MQQVRPLSAAVASVLCAIAAALVVFVPTPSSAAGAATTRARASEVVVRLVPGSRGRGRTARTVSRIDVLGQDGVPRRVRVLRGGTLSDPALDPAGRRVAVVRDDGSIAVVSLRGGRTTVLRPRGLPRRVRTIREYDPTRFNLASTDVSWSPDGRTLAARGVAARSPDRWVGTLSESRSVLCEVRSRRCSSAGRSAPADVVPLASGRSLRIDGRSPSVDADGTSDTDPGSRTRRRRVLAASRLPQRSSISVVRGLADDPSPRVLRAGRSTLEAGITGVTAVSTGPAGVLVRRATVRISPSRDDGSGRPGVRVLSRTLRPLLVPPRGEPSVLPIRLAVEPIGATADGRWVLPTAQAGPTRTLSAPEPELALLNRRGRVRALRVDGRPLTPVGLALGAGLDDEFASGAQAVAAWPVGDDLLVQLIDTGSGGLFFTPGDAALVRVPLAGRGTVRLIDHLLGAGYDVR